MRRALGARKKVSAIYDLRFTIDEFWDAEHFDSVMPSKARKS
jgi:hypothetical protein